MLDLEKCEELKITFQTPSYFNMWTITSQHRAAESSGTLQVLHWVSLCLGCSNNINNTSVSVSRPLLSPKRHRCITSSPVQCGSSVCCGKTNAYILYNFLFTKYTVCVYNRVTDSPLLNHALIQQMRFEPDGNVTSFGELTDFHILLYVKCLGAILAPFNLIQEMMLIFKLT